MPIDRTGPGRPRHKQPPAGPNRHYLYDWQMALGMTDQDIIDRWPKAAGEPPRRETVNRWAHLAINMTSMSVVRVAQALGITPAQLYGPPPPSVPRMIKTVVRQHANHRHK